MSRLIISTVLVLIVPVILLGQINWTQDTVETATYSSPYLISAIDFDGDNDNDILSASWNDSLVCWWENDGSGNFTRDTVTNHLRGAYSFYAIDVDGDTDIDVVCGNGNPPRQVTWCENDGNENFTLHVISTRSGAPRVYAVDLDDDDDVDVISGENEGVYWFRNDGSENFVLDTINIGGTRAVHGVFAIDIDGDNDEDVLATFYQRDSLVWFENDGNENFTIHGIKTGFDGAEAVTALDLDGDLDIDVLSTANLGDDVTWFENDGNENFSEHVIDGNLDAAYEIFAIDLDQDSDIDIVVAGNSEMVWYENDGSEGFTKRLIGSLYSAMYCYAADLDNDTDIDVLGASTFVTSLYWWQSDLVKMHDVATVSIDIDTLVPQDTSFYPRATVKNLGINTETFDVTCLISPGSYSKTENVVALAPDSSVQVTFGTVFNFAPGTYTVTVFTQLGSDEYLVNDTLSVDVYTYDPGVAEDNRKVLAGGVVLQAPAITGQNVEISLTLAEPARVRLVVYDALGRFSRSLVSGVLAAGAHRIAGHLELPSGIYFYHLNTGGDADFIQKFLLIE